MTQPIEERLTAQRDGVEGQGGTGCAVYIGRVGRIEMI